MELVGRTIDQYRVVEEIGRGGMAVVYKAWQASLERYVALKVLPPYMQHDRAFLARFKQEAQSAAKLNHPNIVKIYDTGERDGYSFIVMECVEGQSLQELLAQHQKPMDVARGSSIITQIASALDYAHQKGIVHRDVKPSNILLSADGRAVLTDFGIARASEATRLTVTGMLLGTPDYMSPEQVEGGAIDARSDIYSLGLVAYQVFTGQIPFRATTPQAVLYAQVHQTPPPLTQWNPGLPLGMEKVVFRALEKDPARRYPTAGQFAEALRRTSAGESAGVSEGARRWPPKPAWLWIGAGLAALVVVVLLVGGAIIPPRATPTPAATTPISQITPTSVPTRTITPTERVTRSTRTSTTTPQTRTPGPSPSSPIDAKPVVSILVPADGTTYEVGDSVRVNYRAEDDVGLDRIRLRVDGQLYDEETLGGIVDKVGGFSWRPRTPGEYELEMVVIDTNGRPSARAQVVVKVGESATSTPTRSPTPSRTPTPAGERPKVSCGFGSSACRLTWDHNRQNASYSTSGGQLIFTVSKSGTVRQLYLSSYTFSDFTAEVKVRQHSGHASGAYGLFFRHRDHRNTYRFSVNGKGQFEIGKEQDNSHLDNS